MYRRPLEGDKWYEYLDVSSRLLYINLIIASQNEIHRIYQPSFDRNNEISPKKDDILIYRDDVDSSTSDHAKKALQYLVSQLGHHVYFNEGFTHAVSNGIERNRRIGERLRFMVKIMNPHIRYSNLQEERVQGKPL